MLGPSGFDATVSPGDEPDPSRLAAPGTATFRTTVLPRVEHDPSGPNLVNVPRVRYEEGSTLGRGGVGEVVRADDNDIHRPVAIKRMLPDVESPAALARFVDVECPITLTKHATMAWSRLVDRSPMAAMGMVMLFVLVFSGGVVALGWRVWGLLA